MKTLIISSFLIFAAFATNAQLVTVEHTVRTLYIGSVASADFNTHDFNGEVIEVTPSSNLEMILDINVENNTGNAVQWIASRRRINVPTTWVDFLCWGPAGAQFGGQCIPANAMDSTLWTGYCSESFTVELEAGDTAVLNAHINPDTDVTGCGTYRYYIGTCADPYIDSFDINVCYAVGIDELETNSFDVSVYPNPAQDVIAIKTSTEGSNDYTVLNAVGQIVLEGEFVSSDIINVSNFENGIYYIRFASADNNIATEKIIVSH